MNDAWGYDENDADQQIPNDGPKGLRDYAKDQKARADALEKRLTAMESIVKQTQVADLIESQGVARSAAKFYQGEADPEKITSWVNDMRSTFGGAPSPSDRSADPVLNADDQEQYQRMLQAGANGTTPGNYEVAHQAILSAGSTAERIAAFQAMARGAKS